jgi:hypothetical protein
MPLTPRVESKSPPESIAIKRYHPFAPRQGSSYQEGHSWLMAFRRFGLTPEDMNVFGSVLTDYDPPRVESQALADLALAVQHQDGGVLSFDSLVRLAEHRRERTHLRAVALCGVLQDINPGLIAFDNLDHAHGARLLGGVGQPQTEARRLVNNFAFFLRTLVGRWGQTAPCPAV